MPILTVRAAIVETLRHELPGVDIEEHPRSSFGVEDINLATKRSNVALRVGFRGVFEDVGQADYDAAAPVTWCIWLCSKDVKDIRRDVAALKLIPALARLVLKGSWIPETGDEDDEVESRAGRRVKVLPLYQGESDASSAMLWSIEWTQLTLWPAALDPDIRDFLTLITRYDLAPADGVIEASDTISMVVTEDP